MLTKMSTKACPKLVCILVQLVDSTMPKAGLEPARLAAPPPQDGVSAMRFRAFCAIGENGESVSY